MVVSGTGSALVGTTTRPIAGSNNNTFTTNRQNLKQVAPTLTHGEQPLSRIKSASTVTHDGKLFLFGGFDEDDNLDNKVYILDINSQQWETHRHNVFREGHSAIYIGNDKVLVYGGVPEEVAEQDSDFHELLVYDLKQNTWSTTTTPGVIVPPKRSRHAACLSTDRTKMFISGGLHKDDSNTPYDDLYCYDISTGVWDGPRKFICRFDHFITHHDDKIWSLGGLTNEMAHVTEISWFDLRTNTTGSITINDLPKLEGDHIYQKSNNNSSLLLDVIVPLWTYDHKIEPCIGLYDLQTFRWQAVLTGSFEPLLGYRWRHTFIYDTKLYLLGYPITNDTIDSSFDYKLSSIITLDMSDLGIPGSLNSSNSPFQNGSIVKDLANLLFDEKFTDFKIVGIEGDKRPNINSKFLDYINELDEPFQHDQDLNIFIKSQPLNVHKIILISRWPHFERIIDSGMIEAQTNTLFIPEPIKWLKILIEFLYTDTLTKRDTHSLVGLLILSNLYDLPNLRDLVIEAIYAQGFKIRTILKIWSVANFLNEQILAHNALTFCFYNWGKIVKSKYFRELSKDELITLCQQVENDSIILNGGFDASRYNKKNSNNDNHNSNDKHHSPKRDFILNSFIGYNSSNGFNSATSNPVFGVNSELILDEAGTNNDVDDDETSSNNTETENDLTSLYSIRSRLTTPQASVYLTNPQLTMNSLGEQRDNDDDGDDDTDMEP